LLLVVGIATIAFALARSELAAGQATPDAQAKIENAMSAAPSTVSANATILDNEMDDAGKFVVLHEGSNGWFCLPDDPATPSDDPMCADQTWLNWLYAFVAGEEPPTEVVGLAYMMQGGTTASNTDPLATEPAEGEDWITDPPHVMLLLPGDIDQTVFSTDHASGEPYIMWAGTPYEHIMMPVAEGEMGEMGEMAATPSA
jgi:hypothetical protein